MTDMLAGSVDVPLREEEAERVIASIVDPVQERLVRVAVAEARRRFMRPTDMLELEWRKQLPAAPFDMEFFASIMKDLFSNRELIDRLLRGESIEAATGWDV